MDELEQLENCGQIFIVHLNHNQEWVDEAYMRWFDVM